VNLLSNAVKFTQAGKLLFLVTAEKLGEQVRYEICFAVKDTGIGIAQEQIKHLFKSFSQIDSAISRRYGGTVGFLSLNS